MTIKIDKKRYAVSVNNKPVKLTPKEFEILCLLDRYKGAVVTRKTMLAEVWGYSLDVIDTIQEKTIKHHLCHLRAKLRTAGDRIVTVPHRGYILEHR